MGSSIYVDASTFTMLTNSDLGAIPQDGRDKGRLPMAIGAIIPA
jgi:hypothetical protein